MSEFCMNHNLGFALVHTTKSTFFLKKKNVFIRFLIIHHYLCQCEILILININIMDMKVHMFIKIFIFMLVSREKEWR
jgi:hypothetical protein